MGLNCITATKKDNPNTSLELSSNLLQEITIGISDASQQTFRAPDTTSLKTIASLHKIAHSRSADLYTYKSTARNSNLLLLHMI